MASKESLREKFNVVSYKRQNQGLRLGKELNDLFAFMDATIRKDFQSFNLLSFSICGGQRRNFQIDPHLETAYLALSLSERVEYYELAVTSLIERQKQTSIQIVPIEQTPALQTITLKIIKGLKANQTLRIKIREYVLDCNHFEVPLKKYILRKSKKNPQIFLFQSLEKQEPATIRFEIVDFTSTKEEVLEEANRKSFSNYMAEMNKLQEKINGKEIKLSKNRGKDNTRKTELTPKLQKSINIERDEAKDTSPQNIHDKSVIQQLIRQDQGNQINEQIYQYIDRKNDQNRESETITYNGKRFRKNVVSVMLPQYNLYELDNYSDYLPLFKDESRNIYIYHHSRNSNIYKLECYYRHPPQLVIKHLCELQNYKLWNASVNESQIKLPITSENTFIMYLKLRSAYEWFKERDFLFLRHVFKMSEKYYMIDRSVDNSHFIPFQSIFRGNIDYTIARVEAIKESNDHFKSTSSKSNLSNPNSKLVMEISIQHGGLLNLQSKRALTLGFLSEFANLQNFISRFNSELKNKCNVDWEIQDIFDQTPNSKLMNSMESISSEIFDEPIEGCSRPFDDDEFYSIPDGQDADPVHQITEEEISKKHKLLEVNEYNNETIQLNSNGHAILPQKYLTVRHAVKPMKIEGKRRILDYEHIMLKKDFVHDKDGGMRLVDQVKIAAQNNVIKFIMQTLKKNLFSGKGILNISLPVEIFNIDSNLQRFCESMSLAPDFIERRACKQTLPVQKFKHVIAFGLSNSILYFDIDKAFNPILGETFQGFIDGCPVYAEQISHHPPISSIYLLGRGYKVYANIEAKVYIHLNSGEGVNEGLYTVQFDDGGKVMFQTAPGQVSGLAVGDRKYRIKGKMFVIDPKNRLFCAVNFQDQSGMFSANKWKHSDQMDGQIVRVTDSFIRKFFEKKEGCTPSKKQIEQQLGKISGRWLQSLVIDGQQFYNVKDIPYEMIHYEFPLNSNSNYREDLIFRKKNDLARSQLEKERLEVLQRGDRKFREKYHPAKH